MSDIRFVDELGDALEVAASRGVAAARRSQRRNRSRWLRPRVVAGLAVLVAGGGVATAATLFDQGTTRLAASALSCETGTNNNDLHGAQFFDVAQNGQSPTDACAAVMGVRAASLVACARPSAGVVVYETDGDPDQCRSLGLTPLPAGYSAADARVNTLLRDLTADYGRADCTSPQQLAHEADADLQQLGFDGWHTVIESATGVGSGPCGAFATIGDTFSTAPGALDASRHTVVVGTLPPRSSLRLATRVSEPALVASGRRCYSLAGAQRLVQRMFDMAARRTVPTRFAVQQEPSGTTAGMGRQRYYDQGCTIVVDVESAPDGQAFLVELWNNAGAPGRLTSIPESDFHAVPSQR